MQAGSRTSSIAMTAAACLLAACSMPSGGEVLDGMDLTAPQRAIADALVQGMEKDTPVPMLRKRDYLLAACYATNVSVPPAHERAHLAYLADYTAADDDFYGFFQRYGVGEEEAYALFGRYEAAMAACGNG